MDQNTPGLDAVPPLTRREAAPRRILVAEDDPEMRAMVAEWLSSAGHAVIECSSAEQLIDRLLLESKKEFVTGREQPIDLVITDLRMPGRDGLEALESLWMLPLPPVILITAYPDEVTRRRAERLDVAAVLFKPFSYSDLMVTVSWLTGSSPS